MMAAASDLDVSVLVPAKDEAENLPLFMQQAASRVHGIARRRSKWS